MSSTLYVWGRDFANTHSILYYIGSHVNLIQMLSNTNPHTRYVDHSIGNHLQMKRLAKAIENCGTTSETVSSFPFSLSAKGACRILLAL